MGIRQAISYKNTAVFHEDAATKALLGTELANARYPKRHAASRIWRGTKKLSETQEFLLIVIHTCHEILTNSPIRQKALHQGIQ